MRGPIFLNGFEVDPALARLMSRQDWAGRRTDAAWLGRFPTHPASKCGPIPHVQFCSIEGAIRENEACRRSEAVALLGKPSAEIVPGNFDPSAGYLIGFTDFCDSAIGVDLRPANGPRIIYECLAPGFLFATAFESLGEFVKFYLEQHGA